MEIHSNNLFIYKSIYLLYITKLNGYKNTNIYYGFTMTESTEMWMVVVMQKTKEAKTNPAETVLY